MIEYLLIFLLTTPEVPSPEIAAVVDKYLSFAQCEAERRIKIQRWRNIDGAFDRLYYDKATACVGVDR